MKILVTVKSTSKKKNYITDEEWILPEGILTLKDLLCELTKKMVNIYTSKKIDIDIVDALAAEQINEAAEGGKVGFGRRLGTGKVTEDEAVETMLLAFEDGLFRIYKNERELTSTDENIDLTDSDRIMIIRFVMFAGSIFPYLF